MKSYGAGYTKTRVRNIRCLKTDVTTQRRTKPMRWETFTDSIRRQRDAYKLELPWLTPSSVDASYKVVHNEYTQTWDITFWHGNRGHWLGNKTTLEEAKSTCECHLQTMYRAFSDQMNSIN